MKHQIGNLFYGICSNCKAIHFRENQSCCDKCHAKNMRMFRTKEIKEAKNQCRICDEPAKIKHKDSNNNLVWLCVDHYVDIFQGFSYHLSDCVLD